MVFNTLKNVTTLVEIFGNIFNTEITPQKQDLTLNKQKINSVNFWLL